MISKERLDQYFHDQCSAEEREEITAWLMAHPAELDKYLNEEEWEAFSPPTPSRTVHLFRRSWLRVACAFFVLFACWWWVRQRHSDVQPKISRAAHQQRPLDSLQHIRNTSSETMLARLPDASEITLFPESEIAYRFGDRRNVYLSGKATFAIVKDQSRPFTVYSEQLSTVVLGTSFTITDFKSDNLIRIRLKSGKIRVGRTRADSGAAAYGDLLVPQDLLVYNKQSGAVNIIRKSRPDPNGPSTAHVSRLPGWYMFNEQSLDLVFDQLSVYYGIEIDYYPADIRKCFFTGKYENGDSLDTILRDIAMLNRLSIVKTADGYMVRNLNTH